MRHETLHNAIFAEKHHRQRRYPFSPVLFVSADPILTLQSRRSAYVAHHLTKELLACRRHVAGPRNIIVLAAWHGHRRPRGCGIVMVRRLSATFRTSFRRNGGSVRRPERRRILLSARKPSWPRHRLFTGHMLFLLPECFCWRRKRGRMVRPPRVGRDAGRWFLSVWPSVLVTVLLILFNPRKTA